MSCLRPSAQHLLILSTLIIQDLLCLMMQSCAASQACPKASLEWPFFFFWSTLSSSGWADNAVEASAGTARSRGDSTDHRMAEAGKLRVAGPAVSSASQLLFDSWRCSWSIFKQPGQEGEREEEKEGEAGRGWGWIRPRGCEKQVKSNHRSLLREDSQKARCLHKQGSQFRGQELGHRLLLSAKGPESWGRNPWGLRVTIIEDCTRTGHLRAPVAA